MPLFSVKMNRMGRFTESRLRDFYYHATSSMHSVLPVELQSESQSLSCLSAAFVCYLRRESFDGDDWMRHFEHDIFSGRTLTVYESLTWDIICESIHQSSIHLSNSF